MQLCIGPFPKQYFDPAHPTDFKHFELTLCLFILHMPEDSQCFLYRSLLTPDTGVQAGK